MQIHQLQRSKGLKDKSLRVGRGNGSGRGNYSGKGCKGQKARTGFGMRASFEGGQTSIVQRMPKARGFKRYFKLIDNYAVVNISELEKDTRIENKAEITKELLIKLGYIKKAGLVKVLGNGDLKKSLNFKSIDSFSKTAQEKIQKAGGSLE